MEKSAGKRSMARSFEVIRIVLIIKWQDIPLATNKGLISGNSVLMEFLSKCSSIFKLYFEYFKYLFGNF
jgi:hypothetical protein